MKKKAIEQIRNTFPKITLTVFSLDFHNAISHGNFVWRERIWEWKNIKKLDCDGAGGYDEAFNG